MANSSDTFELYCRGYVGPLIWSSISAPSSCVGVPASVWLLWVLIQRHRQGLTNDIYMLNLTIMDLLFNIYIVPSILNLFFWMINVCYAIAIVLSCFNIIGRPLFTASICVDCYLAVVRPVTYMRIKQGRYRIVICVLIWVYTVAIGVAYYFFRHSISTLFLSTPLITPFFMVPVIVFCDVAILRTLRKPDPSGRNEVHPLKQRALQTIITSLIMTLVSYVPSMVSMGVSLLLNMRRQEVTCNVVYPMITTATLGSTIMPLLSLSNLGHLKGLNMCVCV